MHKTTGFPEVANFFPERKSNLLEQHRLLSSFVVCNGGSIMSPSTISHFVCSTLFHSLFFPFLFFSSLLSYRRKKKKIEKKKKTWKKTHVLLKNKHYRMTTSGFTIEKRTRPLSTKLGSFKDIIFFQEMDFI